MHNPNHPHRQPKPNLILYIFGRCVWITLPTPKHPQSLSSRPPNLCLTAGTGGVVPDHVQAAMRAEIARHLEEEDAAAAEAVRRGEWAAANPAPAPEAAAAKAAAAADEQK